MDEAPWMNEADIADSVRNKYQLKEYSHTKYTQYIPFLKRIPDPEDIDYMDGPKVSIFVQVPGGMLTEYNSPFMDDEDHKIMTIPGAKVRVAKNIGRKIEGLFLDGMVRSTMNHYGTEEDMGFEGHLENAVMHAVEDLQRRDDFQGRKCTMLPYGAADWVVTNILVPLTHHERSIVIENIIYAAFKTWKKNCSLDHYEPIQIDLEESVRKQVAKWFPDRRAAPRGDAYYRFICVLCDSYMEAKYGLSLEYDPVHTGHYETKKDIRSIPAFTAPFSHGVLIKATSEGWQRHCRETHKELMHTLTLHYSERDEEGNVVPTHNLGHTSVLAEQIMEFVGDRNINDVTKMIGKNVDGPKSKGKRTLKALLREHGRRTRPRVGL